MKKKYAGCSTRLVAIEQTSAEAVKANPSALKDFLRLSSLDVLFKYIKWHWHREWVRKNMTKYTGGGAIKNLLNVTYFLVSN